MFHPEEQETVPVDQLSEFRIAGILDELSEYFFPYECRFLNLDATCWKEQMEEFSPYMLFVESIWNGFCSTWRRKLTPNPADEFLELMKYCRERNIPTVFWNKEDPIHFNTFLHAASFFDYVLTTDLDCVPLYKRLLGHQQVYCMPFASCVQIYSPIEKYERKDAACFAGSYYNKHTERKHDFEKIMELFAERGNVEIYDRNPYPNNPDYTYPQQYRKYIVGTLPADKVDIAYKSYKIGITLNIVKRSSTMEARRAFELISCNTLVLSNPCKGLKNLFGDLIVFYENYEETSVHLKQLMDNPLILDKTRLLALRKVLTEHTYRERVAFLYELIYKKPPRSNEPRILVYSVVNDSLEAKRVLTSFMKQKYNRTKMYIYSNNFQTIIEDVEIPAGVQVLPLEQIAEDVLENFDFCAYFHPNNYYGDNYLTDFALSLKYETPTAVGKGCYYKYGQNAFELEGSNYKYKLITRLKADRSMVSVEYMKNVGLLAVSADDYYIEGVPCLSIDPFNFCEGFTQEQCQLVDDLVIDCGLPIEDIVTYSEILGPDERYFSIAESITGNQLFNIIRVPSDKMKKEHMDDGSVGLYTINSSKFKKTSVVKVYLHKHFDADEYANSDGTTVIYYNAAVQGDIKLKCCYYDANDKYLGSYLILNKGCTTIRKKEGSSYFKFVLEVNGVAQMILREIAINPKPASSIINNLNDFKEE